FSAKRAFLEPVLDRVNLHLFTDTMVEKVVFDQAGTAQGIKVRQGKTTFDLMATREVLLSAGAFNSPQLLMLSGVGPIEHLRSHGIEVVADRAEVGANLQEHVDITVHIRNKQCDTIALNPLGLIQLARAAWTYWRSRTGAMAHPPCEVGGFIKSTDQQVEPDLQLHLVSTMFNDSGYDLTPALRYGFSCHVCVLRPQARGTLTLTSSNPQEPPRIQFNFLDNESDQQALIAGVRKVQDILQQPALAKHYGSELMPGAYAQDDELLRQLERHCGLIYHPTSTCRMGLDEQSVVDEKLRVRGVQKLRVVDASIMPQVISGNTNAPTMMIAEQAADFILADYA
ncbi:MAG TPA: GMC oxidoreductase, partial [Pseudidiomarina sp.]|nr:GMC oxidoreductase [Pseudidiomarina sp.]